MKECLIIVIKSLFNQTNKRSFNEMAEYQNGIDMPTNIIRIVKDNFLAIIMHKPR